MIHIGYRDIRPELIERELTLAVDKDIITPVVFKQFKPSNRFISWLFRRYQTEEVSEHWYDHEVEPDDEWTTDRLLFNNWVDVVANGVWDHTQKSTDAYAKRMLKHVRSCGIPRRDRFYIAFDPDHAYIYWYGRDIAMFDYWWIFNLKKKVD